MTAITASKRVRLSGILAAALLACAAPATAQKEAAVLAKGSGPYFETYLAFQRALGRPVTPYDLSKGKPRFGGDLKAVVAFGAKAAALKYPDDVAVIFALAPGYFPEKAGGHIIRISSLPEPAKAVAAYLKLQPGLKKLAVFYSKASPDIYISGLIRQGKAAGVQISGIPLSSPSEFPEILRSLPGDVDALWLLPDPVLINKVSLAVLSEFSCAKKIAFYVPSAGLVPLGATASFAPDFTKTGAAAARALGAVLKGEVLPALIFPEASLTVNTQAAEKCGLPLRLPGGTAE